ncbi:MAG: HAD hydrolase-like protein [Acidobacteria bacterium]|nr:HAD hydrolase-like protein [Acidobacteriota bacterium]
MTVKRPTLIFDLDGTLTDPREGITRCIRHALEHLGLDSPQTHDLERWIGPPLLDTFTAIVGSDRAPVALEAFRARYGEVGLYENRLYDGIASALASLQRVGHTLLVATSKPRPYAVRILEHFDLHRLFDGVYGAELSGERAAKTELLTHLLREERLDAKDAVMIGDRKHDVVAAKAVCMRSVGVAWGFGSKDELKNAGADTICASIDELVTWCGSAVEELVPR